MVTPVTNNTRLITVVRGGREHLWSLFSSLSWLSRPWLMNHYSITVVMEAVMARLPHQNTVTAVREWKWIHRRGHGL